MVQIVIKMYTKNFFYRSLSYFNVYIFKLKSEDSSEKLNEWSIIELQGDLEIESGESLSKKFMGDLHYNSDGTPVLILGHHVLFGKVLSLEKPFLLLKKTRTNVPTKIQIDDDDEDNLKENDDPPETKTLTSYIVKAVIRKKLLFNKRPRPIVYVEAKNRS